MRTAARYKIVVVEYAIVFIGDLLLHAVLVFGARYQHEIFERIV